MTLIETLLSQDAVQRLGWTLVHFVWQGAAVAVLLALGLRLARRRTAGVRYVAGCVAMLVMVALPVVTFVLVPGHQETVAVSAGNDTLAALDSSESDLQAQAFPPPAATVLPSAASASLDPLSETLTTGDEAPVLQVPDSVMVPSEHEAASPRQKGLLGRLEPLLPWLVAIWLVGVWLLSLRLLGGWIHLQRFKRRAVQPVNDRLHQTVSHIAEQLRVSLPVRLLESALVQVPTVIGWLRPVILVPAHVLRDLAPQQLQALLAHELAHIRRYDYLVNLFQTVVESLLFYHPAVWWVSHRIRVERENCCDDLAVSVLGDRVTYARALAELEGLRGQLPQLAVAADGRVLLPRIRRVLRLPGEERGRSPSWMAGSLVLVAFVAVTAALFVRAEQQDPSQPIEAEPSVQPPLQELWQKLDDLDEERRALARRRWDALSVVEQAVIVRRGWTQRGPTEQEMQAVMTEEGARKFLADAKRQLGKHWETHLVGETLDTLTRDEHAEFANRRKELVTKVAELGEAVVGALIEEIERRGTHERDASEALEQLGKVAVPALLIAVASTDEDWPRTRLLEVLAEVEDGRAQQTLERAIGDSFPHARLAALRGLSKLGTATQEIYLRCLEDEYDWLRRMAIGGLAEIGDEKAIPALLVVVRHDLRRGKGGGYWLRREAAEAVVRICERTGKSVELPSEETWQKGKPATFESLSRAANCDNVAIRRDAIFRLGSLREKRTVEFLLDRLRSDPVPQNRSAAVSALYDLLARTDKDTERLQLSHAEREPVFDAVLDAVLREDPLVSRTALGYIGGIAGEYLPDYERFPELFALALRYIDGDDRSLQLAGVQVISRLGRWHTKALEKQLSPERRVRLIAKLKAGMEDSEVGYRIRFIQALGYLREPSVVPRLIELLSHEDATVRAFVVNASGRIGDRRALSALEKVAENDPTTNNKGEFYLREYAQNAIDQIRAEDSQPGQKSAVRSFWEGLDALEAEQRELEVRRWVALSVVEQAQRVHGAVHGGAQPLPQGTPIREPPKFSEQEARKFLAETRQRLGPSWDETFDRAKWSLVSGEEHKAFGDRRRALWSQAAALGETAVGPLIDEIVRKGPRSPDATEALRLLGKPAVPTLLDALPKAKDEWTRARLLDLLASATDPRARTTLERALDDPSWSTRRTALHGLERLGAVPQDVYLRFLKEERDLLRQDAIAGLAKVGDEKAIPALLDVARNDMAQGKFGLGGYYLRRQAIEALKQISERTGQSVELPLEKDARSGPPGIDGAVDQEDLEESSPTEPPSLSPRVADVLAQLHSHVKRVRVSKPEQLHQLADTFDQINECLHELQGKNEEAAPSVDDWGGLSEEDVAQVVNLMDEMENDAEGCRELARAEELQMCQDVWKRLSRKYDALLTVLPEVEGVQCRLRADKTVFAFGEPLTFKVDVRNRGTRNLNVYRTVDRQELELDLGFEVDGRRYSLSPRSRDELPFGPGGGVCKRHRAPGRVLSIHTGRKELSHLSRAGQTQDPRGLHGPSDEFEDVPRAHLEQSG